LCIPFTGDVRTFSLIFFIRARKNILTRTSSQGERSSEFADKSAGNEKNGVEFGLKKLSTPASSAMELMMKLGALST